MSLFGYDFSNKNGFTVVEAWYSNDYETPEYRHIYNGFKSMDEAVRFANERANDKDFESINQVDAKNEDMPSFVAAIVKNGRYVFTCLPSLNVG